MNKLPKSNLHDVSEASLEPAGELANSIELFRAAMHSIAGRETTHPGTAEWLMPARRRHRSAQRRTVLAWACAAALCFAAVPLSIHKPVAPSGNVAGHFAEPSHDDASDTALLEQVDNEIAAPVPSSLSPLTELDSWNSTSSTTESSLDKTEKKNVTQ
jgi:hypothetical protein